eukprot:1195465-Pyramimonas_sp.AAC.1
MKKPVRWVRRAVRRLFRSKGNGRGEGKRRRLHGSGMLTFLTSLTGPQYEGIFLGKGRGRRRTSGK